MSAIRVPVVEKIFSANDRMAAINRKLMDDNQVFSINLMASPGAGKTSFILETIKRLDHTFRIGVIEGDTAPVTIDSDKVIAAGMPAVQNKNGGGRPRPLNGVLPPILNAGASAPGKAFGARNADSCFITMVSPEKGAADVRRVKEMARSFNREVGVFTQCSVLCRSTDKEAKDAHYYYTTEAADWIAAECLMKTLGVGSNSVAPEVYTSFRERFVVGHGGYPIVGDPDGVANALVEISKAGFAGVALNFVNYLDELPFFRDEVLPRIEAKGLRAKRM